MGRAALVTCVDRNTHSLAYGEAAATRLGLSNVRFLEADLSAAAGLGPDVLSPLWSPPPAPAPAPATGSAPAPALAPVPLPVDAVVALHACGGLTDAALALARAHGAPDSRCRVASSRAPSSACPGGGWSRTLCRLAESDRRDISLRAMRAINSRRLQAPFPGGRSRLLAMDERLTARNLVLEATTAALGAVV